MLTYRSEIEKGCQVFRMFFLKSAEDLPPNGALEASFSSLNEVKILAPDQMLASLVSL